MKIIRFFSLELRVKLSSVELTRDKYAGEQSISNYGGAVVQHSH